MTGRVRGGAVLAVGFLVVGLGLRFQAGLALVLALVAPSTDAWLWKWGREPIREEIHVPGAGGGLVADLYRPSTIRSTILLVHGLSASGRRHPELRRLAGLLARHGRLVLVPEFPSFTAFQLRGQEVEEIRDALRYLGSWGRGIGVAGFSFGAGPAIVAAAQGAQPRVVASFGGYADLRHVIRYITTGVHGFGQARYLQLQEEYNRWKLLTLLAGFVESPADRRLLEELARRKLNNPGASVGELTAALGQDGQPVLALALNPDEGAVDQLLAHLPPGALEAIDRLSPLAVVPRLSGRLLIVHGAEDRTIPFTESLRLAEAAGPRARLAILRSFQHAGPDRLWHSLGQRVVDGWRLVGLADDLLDP